MFESGATSVRWSSDLTPSQMRYVSHHQCPTDSEMTCLRNGGKPWAQTFFLSLQKDLQYSLVPRLSVLWRESLGMRLYSCEKLEPIS